MVHGLQRQVMFFLEQMLTGLYTTCFLAFSSCGLGRNFLEILNINEVTIVAGGQKEKKHYMLWSFDVAPVTVGRRACVPCANKFLLYCWETNSLIDMQGNEFDIGEEESAVFFMSSSEAYNRIMSLDGVYVSSERQIVPQLSVLK